MRPGYLPFEVFRAHPAGMGARGRICWNDYTSQHSLGGDGKRSWGERNSFSPLACDHTKSTLDKRKKKGGHVHHTFQFYLCSDSSWQQFSQSNPKLQLSDQALGEKKNSFLTGRVILSIQVHYLNA